VLRTVGRLVEALVEHYTSYPWNPSSIDDLGGRAASLDAAESSVVTMRLANLLEDHLDLGMAYSGKGTKATQADDLHGRCCEIALAMGHHRLATELDLTFAEHRGAALPPPLVRPARASTTVSPLSHRRRADTVARSSVKRVKRELVTRFR
jgi:hypothetical protein